MESGLKPDSEQGESSKGRSSGGGVCGVEEGRGCPLPRYEGQKDRYQESKQVQRNKNGQELQGKGECSGVDAESRTQMAEG